MATKKISELQAVTTAEDNDVLVLVDVSEGTTNKITKGNLLIGAGNQIEIVLDSETYQLVFKLKNSAGAELSTATIDLPSENAITGIEYSNGKLVLTKQSEATGEVDITGLIEGLVTETDFNTFTQTLAETIQGINETIGAINVKNGQQDEAIEENYKEITKLKSKVAEQEEIINQLPQVSGEGESVTLNNTIKAPFTEFEVKGHSEQETTTGKNKLEIKKFENNTTTQTVNGVTATINDDGTIVLNGTASANTDFYVNLVSLAGLNNKLVFNAISGTFNGETAGYAYAGNFSNPRSIKLTNLGNGEINLNSETTYERFEIYVKNGNVYNNTKFGLMVVPTSETDISFEKYTNGASPNPNYEQPIKSAGENVNLLPNNIVTQTKNGVTITKNNDGTLTFNGASTEGFVLQVGTVTIGEDGEYTLSGCPSGGSLQSYFIYNMAGTPDVTDIGNGKTKALNKNDYLNMYINIRANQTFNNLVFKPKLELGSTATPYSPFGMGSITEKIVNKNAIDLEFSNDTSTIAGLNFTHTKSTFTLQGTATGKYKIFNLVNIPRIKANTTYALSAKVTGTNPRTQINLLFKNGNTVVSNIAVNTPTTTVQTKQINMENVNNAIFVIEGLQEGQSYDLSCELQLEENTSATSYVAPAEQTYSIYTQQPMRSIGDVEDEFVLKNDGKWYERHWISRLILEGAENWAVKEIMDENILFQLILSNTKNNSEVLCNNFSKINNIWSNDYEGIEIAENKLRIRIKKELLTDITTKDATIASFKAYLAQQYANETPVYVDYILQEPTDLLCTQEQSDILDSLTEDTVTYQGGTYISSEDEVKARIKVSGLKDLNVMFENLTNAIISQGANT